MADEWIDNLTEDADLETRKAAAAIRQKNEELRQKDRELTIRQDELAAKKDVDKHQRRFLLSPLNVTLLAALAGIGGTWFGNYFQSQAALVLERQKFESELILRAVQAESQKKAAQNLKFLVDIGYVHDTSGLIARLVSSPKSIPLERMTVAPDNYSAVGTLPDAKKAGVDKYYSGAGDVESTVAQMNEQTKMSRAQQEEMIYLEGLEARSHMPLDKLQILGLSPEKRARLVPRKTPKGVVYYTFPDPDIK